MVAGFKIGLSPRGIWRLVKHDFSKFLPSEWAGYVNYFYNEEMSDKDKDEGLNKAWNFHQKRNDHHWQYWVLLDENEESLRLVPIEMPHEALLEMVADWMGAGRAINGRWEVAEWYERYKDTMLLHPKTRLLVENILEEIEL